MGNNKQITYKFKKGTIVQADLDEISRKLTVVVWGWIENYEQIGLSNVIADDFNLDAWTYFKLCNNMIFADRSHVDVDG